MTHAIDPTKVIVLFDGVCNLCNGLVQFLIKRDPQEQFRFASLQSEVGASLLETYGFSPQQRDTVVVIADGKAYGRSDAALKIARRLGGAWQVFNIFRLMPRPMRDVLYDLVAARRYRWFGQKEQCMVPSPENRTRFLDAAPPQPRSPIEITGML
jgi:predicted DCC family thiol-disulfide oxidoreductase YuxK